MKYSNIREEELKNKVGQDYFSDYDTTMIIGNIDFCVIPKSKDQNQKKYLENIRIYGPKQKLATMI